MKFLDLFAGIGGFRLGMEAAGHECVGYVEWDKFARKSYQALHNTKGEWTAHDITSVTDDAIRGIGSIDIICGGFPCQTFSIAGKRKGFEDTRGTLFFEIMRFASILRPRYLFLENVTGLLNHNGGDTFETILGTLDEVGYDAEWDCLNSKNFGVPQNRERVFIIGHLRGSGGRKIFPLSNSNGTTEIPIEIIAHRKDYRRNTQVFHPSGITEALDSGQGGGRGHYTISDNQNKILKVGNIRKNGKSQSGNVFDANGIAPTLCSAELQKDPVKIVQPVLTPDRIEKRQNGRRFKEDGEPMFTLTAQDRHGIAIREATKQSFDVANEGDSINLSVPGSQTRRGRVGKGMANTLDTTCNQGVLEDMRIRKLTPRECWRLQGFPDWAFERAQAVNSDSQLYKQAGNSVTVNVIAAIAREFY